MLAADKQLLDATLKHNLQELRRLELTNVVQRYQNAIPAATLICGFCFTGIVELEIVDNEIIPTDDESSNGADLLNLDDSSFKLIEFSAEMYFYFFSTFALALSLYVMAVSSMAIVFGTRLSIMANQKQAVNHDANVKELQRKFIHVLVAMFLAVTSVILASVAVIWVKAAKTVSIPATITFLIIIPLTAQAMWSMNSQLNTDDPQAAQLKLATEGDDFAFDVTDFHVGDAHTRPKFAGKVTSASLPCVPGASKLLDGCGTKRNPDKPQQAGRAEAPASGTSTSEQQHERAGLLNDSDGDTKCYGTSGKCDTKCNNRDIC